MQKKHNQIPGESNGLLHKLENVRQLEGEASAPRKLYFTVSSAQGTGEPGSWDSMDQLN